MKAGCIVWVIAILAALALGGKPAQTGNPGPAGIGVTLVLGGFVLYRLLWARGEERESKQASRRGAAIARHINDKQALDWALYCGEITRGQYNQRRRALDKHAPAGYRNGLLMWPGNAGPRAQVKKRRR